MYVSPKLYLVNSLINIMTNVKIRFFERKSKNCQEEKEIKNTKINQNLIFQYALVE